MKSLPVVLHGHKTQSLTLREAYRLKVFEMIFGSKREDVTGG
jgi:hypothetical protein